jgi:hypothetical protein
MPVSGTPLFNAVTLLEMEGVSWAAMPVLVGHAAYVNTNTGKTYGRTTIKSGWSEETLRLLDALRGSMEEDVAKLVFESGSGTGISLTPAAPGGIGEHLHEETDQV